MSSAASLQTGADTRSTQPTKSVQRAMRRFGGLNASQLGPQGEKAWFDFLSPVYRATERRDDKAHEWATAFLTEAQPILDALGHLEDRDAAGVLRALRERWSSMRAPAGRLDVTAAQVVDWIVGNSPAGAADCIRLVPPDGVEIVDRVGTRSYQKRVYRATWDASGRRQEIVLKEFLGDAASVIPREMQAYPLSMLHPNIIQTYRLENPVDVDRPFLAERRIHPLDEDWQPGGLAEAGLVLTDLARALAFLAEQNLVHGDIKPDNIGYDRGSYLLLDFGVARKREAFAELPEPTGTLSTRAPEIIRGLGRQTPQSDVYALAACIFFFLYRRYPLIGPDDDKGDPKSRKRDEYVADLKARLDSGWVGEVHLLDTCEHFGLRMLLRDMLHPDPKQRPTADQVLKRALKDLPALVGTPLGPFFRASDELQQMDRFLSRHEEDMRLLTQRKSWDLQDRLKTLEAGLRSATADDLVEAAQARTIELLECNWPAEVRELLETARQELSARQEGSPYDEMILRLRGRIGFANQAWPELSSEGLRALKTLASSTELALRDPAYVAELEALVEVLERAASAVSP